MAGCGILIALLCAGVALLATAGLAPSPGDEPARVSSGAAMHPDHASALFGAGRTTTTTMANPANLAFAAHDSPVTGSLEVVAHMKDGVDGFLELHGAKNSIAFGIGGGTYAAIAADRDNGIQMVDVTDPANPVAIAHVRDSDTRALEGVREMDTFEVDGRTYLVAVSKYEGVQIIDVTDPRNPAAAGYLLDNAWRSLGGAGDVATFAVDGEIYAAVPASLDHALQIVNLTDPLNPALAGRLIDDSSLELGGALGVDVFDAGGSTYAIVTGKKDNGIQIVNVTDPYNPTAAGRLADSAALELYHAFDVAVFVVNQSTYAVVAGYEDYGIQVIDISDPYRPVAAGRISDPNGWMMYVQVDTFTAGGHPYALLASYDGAHLHLVDLSDPYSPAELASIRPPEYRKGFAAEVFGVGGSLYALTTSTIEDSAYIVGINMSVDLPPGLVPNPPATTYVRAGSAYEDAGATCTDEADGDLTGQVRAVSTVNFAIPGVYTVTYACSDSAGNEATAVRTVTVAEAGPAATPEGAPAITVLGADPAAVAVGDAYSDAGATCVDEADGDLTGQVRAASGVNVYASGNYTVTYACSDSDGNEATAVRTVTVTDTDAPDIALVGGATVRLYAGDPYTDEGATCIDEVEGDLEDYVAATGEVDTATAGLYTVTYTCSDSAGNEATTSRTVDVLEPIHLIADGVGNFTELDGAEDVAVFSRDGGTYAVIAAYHDDGVQVVDLSGPARPVAAGSLSDGASTELDGARGVAVFSRDGGTYAVVAAYHDDGVQVVDLSDPARPVAAGSLSDGASTELDGARGVAVFSRDGGTYAVVTGYLDDGVQIVNVTDPANPVAAGSLSDDASTELDGAAGVAVFNRDGGTYAVVAAYRDDGVQIVNVTDPANPAAAGRARDGQGLHLDGAMGVAVFERRYNTHAVVTTFMDNTVQIVRVTDPSQPSGAGHIAYPSGLILGLDGVDVYEGSGGSAHAVIAQNMHSGVQVVDVSAPYKPALLGTTHDDTHLKLAGAQDAATFSVGGRVYAIVTAFDDDGAHVLSIDAATPAPAPPVITLNGASPVRITVGSDYGADAGATCVDEADGDITGRMQVASTVDTDVPGSYTVTYTCIGSSGQAATAVREVRVEGAAAPAFLSASYSAGNGTLAVAFDMPVNSTVHLDRLHVRDAGQSSGGTALEGAAAWSVSGPTLDVSLTATQTAAVAGLAVPQLDIGQDAVFSAAGAGIAAAPDRPILVDGNGTASDDEPPTRSFAAVLDPPAPLGSRDIGRITLNSSVPGTIQATWEEPSEDPANYRIVWAKVGEPFKTWTDPSGNAFPTAPSHTITGLEGGEQYKVKIRASYAGTSGGWSGELAVTVAESAPANRPPAVDAGPDRTVQKGETVTLSGTATDPDGDPMAYVWTSDRPGLSVSGGRTLSPSFAAAGASSDTTITFTLTATDPHNATGSDTVAVTVLNADSPPRNIVVLEPPGTQGPRDIGTITLNGSLPGTIQATWAGPSVDPADYRIIWAKSGDPYKTWTDPSGNAFPAEPSHTITGLEEGEEYKVKIRARYGPDGSGGWSGQAAITVAASQPASPPPADRHGPFVTTWKTTSPGESITIPVGGAPGTYTVDWGDGTVSANVTGSQIHAYDAPGTHTVSISGNFEKIYLNGQPNAEKLQSIEQWGDVGWTSMNSAFEGASKMVYRATDTPDLSAVTDMSEMFHDASSFDGDISGWDVSSVTDMQWMFHGASSFNQNLSSWDVSSVTDMSRMFSLAYNFNGDVSGWDVSSVTDMGTMFSQTPFDGDISGWDVSSVTDMHSMFSFAASFDGDVSGWDVSSVTDMHTMFSGARSFDGDISGWDVSSATNTFRMFFGASSFNQNLSSWDVSSATNLRGMFYEASSFDGDISGWDVSSATDVSRMFAHAASFDGDISGWDVSSVTDMHAMFYEASSFDGDISGWDVSSVTDMHDMFYNAASFDGDISGWDVSSATNMSGMFEGANSFGQNLGNWYVVLDAVQTVGQDGEIGSISAQNPFLGSHRPAYGLGSGHDSGSFEITDGSVLKLKTPYDAARDPYVVTVTSTGYFGTHNFRIFEITLAATGTNDTSVTVRDVTDDLRPSTVVLGPKEAPNSRDIGTITLTSLQPGTIEASWAEPADTPADYRIAWAKSGEPYKTWTDLSGNAFPTEPSYTITGLEGGEGYKVQIVARYGPGSSGDWSGAAVIIVRASHSDNPPAVDAGTDQAVREGDTVTLRGTASDPDGDAMTYLWTHDMQGLGISLGNATALSTTFAAPSVDSEAAVTFTLTATDENGAAGSDTVTVTVRDAPSDPPANVVVLEPIGTQGPRDIGTITLNGSLPGTIQATWEGPSEDPANYRIMWAKVGEPYKTWADPSGNAFPTAPAHAITGLEGGEQYKVKVRASYAGTAGGWSGELAITVR